MCRIFIFVCNKRNEILVIKRYIYIPTVLLPCDNLAKFSDCKV